MTKKKEKQDIIPTEEERDLEELIQVFKANVAAPRCQWPLNPDAVLTKGNMTYLIEVLEEYQTLKAKVQS